MVFVYAVSVVAGSVVGIVTHGIPGLIAGYVAGAAGAAVLGWRRKAE
jgi:hypothetical protein